MTLTGEPQKQNIKIQFKIIGTKDGKLATDIIGYELNNTAMKRLVRRGRTKIQDSLVLETADKKKVRVKVVAVTRNKIASGAKKEIRKKLIEYIKEQVAKTTFEDIIRNLMTKRIQRPGADALKKICPVFAVEINKIFIIEEKKLG
jgi:ribosomal protein S3AE